MKRFHRFILNAVTALSLLLCAGVVLLWVRSYWREDCVERVHAVYPQISEIDANVVGRLSDISLTSSKGRLWVFIESGYTTSWAEQLDFLRWDWFRWKDLQTQPEDTSWHRVGLAWNHTRGVDTRNGIRNDTRFIAMPHWLPALVLFLLPLLRLIRYRRRRSLALAGHCIKCGYDLRATPDRCPECGTIPGKPV